MLYFQNTTNLYWIDQSPYAFQAWYNPMLSQASHVTTIVPKGQNVRIWIAKYNPSNEVLQPDANSNHTCGIIDVGAGYPYYWKKNLCTASVALIASYVCEIRSMQNKSPEAYLQDTIIVKYVECPANSTIIGSACVLVTSIVNNGKKAIKKWEFCQVGNMYSLPDFVTKKSPETWTGIENFLVETLRLAFHRWPSIIDFALIDKHWTHEALLVSMQQNLSDVRKEVKAVFFTKTLFSNIMVQEYSKVKGDVEVFHVICSIPPQIGDASCLPGHHTCDDGTCILEHYVCDGVMDCPDDSDEQECQHVCSQYDDLLQQGKDCYGSCSPGYCTCHDLYFQCSTSSGGCVPWSQVCDGIVQCSGMEDEKQCIFYHNGHEKRLQAIETSGSIIWEDAPKDEHDLYTCSDGSKIDMSLVGDLVPDCVDQTDESTYSDFLRNFSSLTFSAERLLCTHLDETTCEKNYPGVCYPHKLRCVYEAPDKLQLGCRNAGHLRKCAFHHCPNHFKCPDAYCIPVHTVCNGRQDCPNGEDEKDCRPLSCPGFLKCRADGVCVHPHDLRAKHVICNESKDDKTLQGMIACPTGCHCTGNAILCKNIQLRSPLVVRIFARKLIYQNVTCKMESSCWEPLTLSRFLISLEMSRCGIFTMDLSHIRDLAYLKILKITHNRIKTIRKQFFRNTNNLEVIDLRHNNLRNFDDVFAQTNIVRILRLDHNNIRMIAKYAFARLQQLEILTLSFNNIGSLGQNIQLGNPTFLKEVNISHNPVVHIDHQILIHVFQGLSILDSTPIRLCCLLESIKKCYPQISHDRSLCLRLIPSALLHRVIFWLLGFVLLFSILVSIAWFVIKQLSEARNLINILSLWLFISDSLTACYFLTMTIADSVLSPNFALYEAYWRSHTVCKLLKASSLFSFMNFLFISFLISSMRMISVAFPFKIASMSPASFYTLSGVLACYLCVFGALGLAEIDVESELEARFCLGIIFPGTGNKYKRIFAFILPGILTYILTEVNQVVIVYSINASLRRLKPGHVTRTSRRKIIIRCCIYFLLLSLSVAPFLIIQIFALISVDIATGYKLFVTLTMLSLFPIMNNIVHVSISPSFTRYLVQKVSRVSKRS